MKHRRYLTFSLRTLFVLLTASAVWTATIVNRAREQREAVKAIEAAGGEILYDWQSAGRKMPVGPHWQRQAVGSELFQAVERVTLRSYLSEPEILR